MSGSGKKRPPLVADRRYRAGGGAKTPRKGKASRRSAAKPAARRRGLRGVLARAFGWLWRLVWGTLWRGAVVAALLVALAVFYIFTTLPPMEELVDGRARGSVTLLDRDGEVFAWRGEQFGGTISVDTVSPHLKNAVIATEDRRFYQHLGISPRGIAGAIRINLREGRGPLAGHGGSTITQQTAKLLCLGVAYDPDEWESEAAYEADCREGSIWRKVKEAIYALALEARYSKDEILTIYLNRAFLGAGSRGFEAAAQRYFGKSAAELNPSEAAMLAGLLVAPTRYAPTNDLERSRDRASVVLGLMAEQGYLTPEQLAEARANPASLSEAAEARAGGYFADWMMQEGPDFLTRDTTEDVIIRTTYDPRIQQAAEDALTWVFENKVSEGSKAQAAIVVMSADGAVRAMVGGRKLRGVSGAFNRAVQAKRQTGSAFKPFVYATALELGWRYDDTVLDAPITIDVPGSGPWSPKNYSGEFKGEVTLTDALALSLNTPAVRISEAVGRENVRHIANEFGIESDLAVGPALALGASESSLLEMTGAYAGILNGGSSVTPYGLIELRLQGDQTPLIGQAGGMGERVISRLAAGQLVYMMKAVVERGTGRRAALQGREVAGKTGTTQAARDAWFLGFTADYVAGVWMGYDDNTPLTGVTGSGLPAEIWHETMRRVHEGIPPRALPVELPGPRVAETRPAPQVPAQPQQQPGRERRESVIDSILRDIFGPPRRER